MIAVNRRVLSLNKVLNLAECLGGGITDPLDMLRDKQQVIWIDVTGLNEALGLLCAAAGIVRVHQSALAVHELVEVAAGTREALPEVVGRHLQDFTTNGVARSEDFPEREDQSLLAVQTEQHPGCAGDF